MKLIFNNYGHRIAILIKNKNGLHSIGCSKDGKKGIEVIFKDGNFASDRAFSLNGSLEFSETGKWLFFYMNNQTVPAPKTKKLADAVNLNIWSYKDYQLQPDQEAMQ